MNCKTRKSAKRFEISGRTPNSASRRKSRRVGSRRKSRRVGSRPENDGMALRFNKYGVPSLKIKKPKLSKKTKKTLKDAAHNAYKTYRLRNGM
jgi:hypothetical protein